MEIPCTVEDKCFMYVSDNFDRDDELEIGIQDSADDYLSAYLSKDRAKKLAEHILHLLEESK